jgi:hypothetical protein
MCPGYVSRPFTGSGEPRACGYANPTHILNEPDALEALQLAPLLAGAAGEPLLGRARAVVLNVCDHSAHAPLVDAIFRPIEQQAEAGHAAHISRDLETLLGSYKINRRK